MGAIEIAGFDAEVQRNLGLDFATRQHKSLQKLFEWLSLANSLLHLLTKHRDFLNTDIAQGSVSTHLGCGGVFKHDFVTNFLLSLTVKEF